MKLEFFPETCCEICGNIIHNHFDCPVCKKENSGTSMYHPVDWLGDVMGDETFHCEECNTKYKLISKSGNKFDYNEWEWEIDEINMEI